MNRANQNALFQQTNLGLLSIRQAELNYYVSLNIAFGTQAALIGGFTYGVFTQNQINEDEYYASTFMDIYWVISAGTIAASVHVIITTMCIQVLGPGLALHGPVGSMARSTQGMREEQKPVIASFIIMMILFSLSTILSFWSVMSFYSALAGTILFIVAGRYWYYYSERIYLRFFWDDNESRWQMRDDSEENPAFPDHPPLPNPHTNPLHDQVFERRTSQRNDGTSDRTSFSDISKDKGKKKSLIRAFRFPRTSSKRKQQTTTDSTTDNRNSASPIPGNANSNRKEPDSKYQVMMEGYLLKKGSYGGGEFKKEPWERKYFTLNHGAQLYMYKTRQDYHNNSKQPIYHRPLNLHEFLIEIFNSEDPESMRGLSMDSARSGMVMDEPDKRVSMGATSDKKLRFQITLIPKENLVGDAAVKRQNWIFRCDTEEELEIWTSAMRQISPDSFVEHHH